MWRLIEAEAQQTEREGTEKATQLLTAGLSPGGLLSCHVHPSKTR